MPRKRFASLAVEKKRAILDSAATEFATKGYEGASINRVIEDAGISKGTLYYYFDDKEDLFVTVLQEAMDRLMAGTGFPALDGLSAKTFWNAYRDFMMRSVEFLKDNEFYVRLVRSYYRVRERSPGSPATRPIREWGVDMVSRILARGQELEVVRTDLPLPLLAEVTLAVDEAGDRWRLEHWDELSHAKRLALADAHIDLMRDMLHAKNQGWEE